MSGPNFDQQEQFDAGTVEAVTRTKRATLRQWETREIYVCDLRRGAPSALQTIMSPDRPGRIERAKDILEKYERGWRSYTLGDLVRISYINALMDAGVDAREAGRAAMALYLPEAHANSQPSGRELMRLQNPVNDPDIPDEFVLFAPKRDMWPQMSKRSPGNPFAFRLRKPVEKDGIDPSTTLWCAAREWEDVFGVLRLLGPHAAAMVNLSDLRREVLTRLEEFERGSEDGR